MLTINFENINLSVTQRDSEVKMEKRGMNGRIVVSPEENHAWFMEAVSESIPRNPVVMRGKRLRLRTNSDGRIRGTFMLDGIDNEDIETVGKEIDALIVDLQSEYGVKTLSLRRSKPKSINIEMRA